ncbi:DUF5693 family protein [Tissierella sp.]|uniref:DUF5693 family protein n=1 Tax=Tissierella sp. TaxID=41274 RepID=UPI00285BBB4E|nr:DUF5693 family protein [Tissierella sp.]MDR7856567.1 DUF5693 family protein [Tissierella sp.]
MKNSRLMIIFILIGIISSFILSFNRIGIESDNKTIDFTLDLIEIEKLAGQSDEDLSWWLRKFKDLGVGSVTLNEVTFEAMMDDYKPIEVKMLGNIVADMNWKNEYPQDFIDYIEKNGVDKYDVVVTTNSESLFTSIEDGLKGRYEEDLFEVFKSQNDFIFLLDATVRDALFIRPPVLVNNYNKPYIDKKELISSKLIRLGLGFDEEKIKTIKEAGLEVILRPMSYNPSWCGEKYINANLEDYARFDVKAKYMIFSGEEVMGYPANIDIVREFMEKNNTKIGLIESGVQRGHIEQEGLDELTEVLDYNAIRVFSIPPYIQERYKFYNYSGSEEIENTIYRAVTERNIRLVFFRPFKYDNNSYVTNYEEYERMFESFEERIAEHGMVLGDASVMPNNTVNIIFKILIGLGILGGGIIMLEGMFNINEKFKKLLIIAGILFIIVFPFAFPYFSVKIYAMLAAVVFPTLSMIYFCSRTKASYFSGNHSTLKQSILKGLGLIVTMALISSIGALYVASLLSSTEFLLEMDIFRGVKISQLIPILLYSMTFLGYFGYRKEKDKSITKINISDIKDILVDNIKIYFLVLFIVVAAAGYVYLARTGHETNVQPSDLEMIGRNFLELKLIARPRIKEFIVAFPAIILGIYAAINRKKLLVYLAGLAVVIGQTSIVNTFTHLRTPMYLSIFRTFYGLIFGIVLGVIYVIILDTGVKLVKTLRGEWFNE